MKKEVKVVVFTNNTILENYIKDIYANDDYHNIDVKYSYADGPISRGYSAMIIYDDDSKKS
jgi:hypothetical protein